MMKTILPLSKIAVGTFIAKFLILSTLSVVAQSGTGQSVPELVFKDPKIESGNPGNDGTVYRFKQVATDIDVLLKIVGRSSSRVKITNIDLSNTGYDNAFQPRVSYNNGSAARNTSWWVEFSMNFVREGSSTPVSVNAYKVTALDIDGDDNRLSEYVSFYKAKSYTVEQNSSLSIKTLTDLLLGVLTPGVEFRGSTQEYSNVSTTATNLMATVTYTNMSSFNFRAGAVTGSTSSGSTDRMYSFWFKGFDYNTPSDVSLPVKLVDFSAFLTTSDVVYLKWTTATEKNVSHFEIEKSMDGKNYEKAAVAFAFGNSTETINYAFTDKNIDINSTGVIYYRLRTVDNDGSSELSHVRSIRTGKKSQQGISIVAYPNPVTTTLQVTIPSSWQGKKVNYQLYNNSGQSIFSTTAATGSQTESLDISRIAPGFYLVKASCNGEAAQEKIIKK